MTMHKVWFRFGNFTTYRKYEFTTLEELNAFIKGVQAAGDAADSFGFDYEQQDHPPHTEIQED
jgi:hypothetical protein